MHDAPVEITLVDRRNFHLFQPLTYQVATGALSPGEVAYPLRALFKRFANVRVAARRGDRRSTSPRAASSSRPGRRSRLRRSETYDTLVVAAGSSYSYFGHDEWSASRPRSSRWRARSPSARAS